MARLIGLGGEIVAEENRQLELIPDLPPVTEPPEQLRKSVAVVHMYPVNGAYSHFCRRVYNALLVLALRVWNSMDVDTRVKVLEERRVLTFSSTVAEIAKVLRATTKATERIYEAVEQLYKLECKFDVMKDTEQVWKVSTRLVSQWARPHVGTGEIQWEYPPDIFELLMKPMPYAVIDLRLANRLSSSHALALYENTNRYARNPGQLTAKLPVLEWARLIMGSPSAERFAESGQYRYFKRDVLMPAIKELNSAEACPIQLTLLETKGPRNKVTHLQFKVEPKTQFPLPTETGQTGDPRLEAKMREWGVSESIINRFLLTYEETELWHYVRQFEQRLARGGVRDPAAAFVDAVQRSYYTPSFEQTKLTQAKVEAKVEAKQTEAKQKKLEDEFSAFVRGRVRTFFESQPKAVQEELVQAFLNDPNTTTIVRMAHAKKGLNNPLVAAHFYPWLGRQDGVLTRPEELRLEWYIEWRETQAGSAV